MTVTIEIDADVVDLLCRLRWLEPGESHDRSQIGHAIASLLAAAARG
jgi:hypothetical protein